MRRWGRLVRAELLLPLGCIGAAILVGASEFMTTFELTPPGGEPLQAIDSQHAYALLLLAVFATGAVVVAVTMGSKPAAIAVAAAGAAALLVFLTIDLPDVNRVGTIEDEVFVRPDARAEPQLGFWLEAVGAVLLTLTGGALATLTRHQLQALMLMLRREKEGVAATDSRPAGAASRPPGEGGREGAGEEAQRPKGAGRIVRRLDERRRAREQREAEAKARRDRSA